MSKRHYVTYGGDDSGGIVRKKGAWRLWENLDGLKKYNLKIPNELQVIYKLGENNVEYFKLELTDYVLKEGETHFTYTDDPEYDEIDNTRCDCCNEYWADCLRICANCHDDYNICRYNCYDT